MNDAITCKNHVASVNNFVNWQTITALNGMPTVPPSTLSWYPAGTHGNAMDISSNLRAKFEQLQNTKSKFSLETDPWPKNIYSKSQWLWK